MGENFTNNTSTDDVILLDKTTFLSDAQRTAINESLLIVRYVCLAISLPVTVCNVIVFLQKRMRNATSVYILGLSFAQICFLSAHIGLILWSNLYHEPRTSFYFCLYKLYAINFGSVIARRGSYVILCFVSTERVYAIMRPLHIKSFVLSKFSVTVMVATFLITAIFHLYLPAKLEIVMAEEETTGIPVCLSQITALYIHHKDINDTFSLAVKILMTYTALILQILLNVLTIWALRRHNIAVKHVQSAGNEKLRRQRERQLTVTILVTSIAYVILSFPACLNGLLNMVIPDFSEQGMYRNLASVVYNLCLDLKILSCSVDFICFFALSSSYRKTFFRVFPCFRAMDIWRKKSGTDTEETCQSSVETE